MKIKIVNITNCLCGGGIQNFLLSLVGSEAKLFGKIIIADHCRIGANVVVDKNFELLHSIIVGCPATVIRIEEKQLAGITYKK